jgi:hypothetical protein
MKIWQSLTDADGGYLCRLSEAISIMEAKYPDTLACVADGVMIIASDYSGQHKGATHEAYSFLITTDSALQEWLPSLRAFRERWLPDNRRLSYKKLNEPVRWRALPSFLAMASGLHGNLFSILVDKRVASFIDGGPDAAIDSFPDCFPVHTKRGTIEKMFRLAGLVSLILAGLRRENQESNWISDHDETLDSHEKREGFKRLASYLTFGLTGWRNPAANWFGTTESELTPYWSEDVAALADLVAGAYCQMSEHLPTFFGTETWETRIASAYVDDPRARMMANWLSSAGSLKHVLLRLEPDTAGEVRCSAQAFAKK